MPYQEGRISWCKGLTNETDSRVARRSVNSGIALKGRGSWNKGLTKDTDIRVANASPKISKARIGKHYPKLSEAKLGLSSPYKGLKKSPEHCRNISLANMGKRAWNLGITGYHNSPYPLSHRDDKTRAFISERTREAMAEMPLEAKQEMFRNLAKALQIRPNKPEIKLGELIEKACPGEYTYTGDGSLMVFSYAPDYTNINGQKKLIEMFGDYWHTEGSDIERIELFKSFGFACLVIWESELDGKPEEELIALIRDFNNGRKVNGTITIA